MQLSYTNILHPIVPLKLISQYSSLRDALSPIRGRRTLPHNEQMTAIHAQLIHAPLEWCMQSRRLSPFGPATPAIESTPIAEGHGAVIRQEFASSTPLATSAWDADTGVAGAGPSPPPYPPMTIELTEIPAPPPRGPTKKRKASQRMLMQPCQQGYETRSKARSKMGANAPNDTTSSNPGKRVARKKNIFGKDDSANAIAGSSATAVEPEGQASKKRKATVPKKRALRRIPSPQDVDDSPSPSSTAPTSSPNSCPTQFPQPKIARQTMARRRRKSNNYGTLIEGIQVPQSDPAHREEAPTRGTIITDILGPPSAAVIRHTEEVKQRKEAKRARTLREKSGKMEYPRDEDMDSSEAPLSMEEVDEEEM